jgi:hypothetical protein
MPCRSKKSYFLAAFLAVLPAAFLGEAVFAGAAFFAGAFFVAISIGS